MPKLTVEELKHRKKTYLGIYADVGKVLDKFSTQDLFDFASESLNMDTALRYYLEQQITAYARVLDEEASEETA